MANYNEQRIRSLSFPLEIEPLLREYDLSYSTSYENDKEITLYLNAFYTNLTQNRILKSIVQEMLFKIKEKAAVMSVFNRYDIPKLSNSFKVLSVIIDAENEIGKHKIEVFSYNGNIIKNKPAQASEYFEIKTPIYAVPLLSDEGLNLGFLAYNTIAFYFPLFNGSLNKNQAQFFRDVLSNYSKLEPQLKEIWDIFAKSMLAEKLSKYLDKKLFSQIETLKNDIYTHEKQIENYQKNLNTEIKNLHEKSLKLEFIESTAKNTSKDKEEKLLELINTYDLKFDEYSDYLYITTKDITIKGVVIGNFTIKIDIVKGTFTINNNIKKVNDIYDHPHIRNGIFCLGNMQSEVVSQIAKGNLFEAVKLCEQMLYFYNASSVYRNYTYWK